MPIQRFVSYATSIYQMDESIQYFGRSKMKTLITAIMMLLFHPIHAQTDQSGINNYLSLTGGFSTHGTGDMNGVSQKVLFGKYFRKKLSWSVSLGSSLHDGSYAVSYNPPKTTAVDNSYRYTAGGFQVGAGAAYSLIRRRKSEFGVRVEGIVRYQSSSYFDSLLIVENQTATGIPHPSLYIFNTSPQRTCAVGVAPDLFFNHSISKSLFLGVSAGFQADTNGDVLTNLSFSIGKRFN